MPHQQALQRYSGCGKILFKNLVGLATTEKIDKLIYFGYYKYKEFKEVFK